MARDPRRKGRPKRDHLAAFRRAVENEVKNDHGGGKDRGPDHGQGMSPEDKNEFLRKMYRNLSSHWDETLGAMANSPPPNPAVQEVSDRLIATKRVCDAWGLDSPDPAVGIVILSLMFASTDHPDFAVHAINRMHELVEEMRGEN